VAAEPTPRRFNVVEYYRMGKAEILKEDDRVELIEGEIIQMPPIGNRHASCVGRLTRLLIPALGERAFTYVQNPEIGATEGSLATASSTLAPYCALTSSQRRRGTTEPLGRLRAQE